MRSSTKPTNRHVHRNIEAIDKLLDSAVAKILLGRPMNLTSVGPKLDCSGSPKVVGGKRQQRLSPNTYILPSRRKELKGQIPENVRIAKELHPMKGAGRDCIKEMEIAVEGISSSSLMGSEPDLSQGGNGKRLPQPFPGISVKKWRTTVAIIFDTGLHEGKGRQISRIPRTK